MIAGSSGTQVNGRSVSMGNHPPGQERGKTAGKSALTKHEETRSVDRKGKEILLLSKAKLSGHEAATGTENSAPTKSVDDKPKEHKRDRRLFRRGRGYFSRIRRGYGKSSENMVARGVQDSGVLAVT